MSSFVPAGYYDNEEEDNDGFFFGDEYDDGQFEDSPMVVSKSVKETSISSPRPSGSGLPQQEVAGHEEEEVAAGGPLKGGKGSLFSADSFSDTSLDSSTPCHGNHSGGGGDGQQPVKFNISGEQLEYEKATEDMCKASPGRESRTFSSLRKTVSVPTSSGLDKARSRGQLKQLEALEAMKVALSRGNVEQVEELLNEGFDPNAALSSGWPPLLHACDNCQEKIVKLLLDRGASPNANKDLVTGLMVTCMKNSQHLQRKAQACVRLLLDKGARVNARDRHHMTPLLYACQACQTGLAELLVSAEADVNAKDVRGWTPLLYAASNGHIPLLRLLIKAGADPKATNVQLESPAAMAYSSGHTAAADWLEAVVTWKRDGEGGLTSELPPHPLLQDDLSDGKSSDQPIPAASSAPPPSWSSSSSVMGDLEMFLMGLQLSDLIPLFQNHRVEFGQLLSMTDSDLQGMGVTKVGHRKKILNGVLEVHKREWIMPDNPLPYGRPISSAELAVIMSNLSSHAQYIQGTARFLLTHVQSNPDLLGPHMEPIEAKKLAGKLSDTVGAVQRLRKEVAELRMVAECNLPAEALSSDSDASLTSSCRSKERRRTMYVVIGIGCLSLALYHFLTH